jgi:glutathione synthase/RimK-type ligase-like ATP-grasp enzyme
LIITNKDDITTDFIVNKLNQRAETYFRLNTESLITNIGIDFNFTENRFRLIDYSKNEVIDLSRVTSIYYRRPKLPQLNYDSISKGENDFISREIGYFLEGLYRILNDKYWISPIEAIRKAESKIYQLVQAKSFGFDIPDSLITTLQNNAQDFIKNYPEGCVIKPIRNGFVQDDIQPKIIFTSSLPREQLNLLDGVQLSPTYLQRKIEKMADLRVTVVGNKVFAAKIYSQEFEDTIIDWRKGENVYLKHEKIDLPITLEQKCIEFVKSLGLIFGAIDFILDKNGRFIFLEINPNGQWAWIENRLGYDISGEIVNLLIRG